ncbi:MAG: ArgE/DapE family deacylase [Chloroflexi bacterium]|nr:ArgE/DapE family deacylase [Chloroflexota bacterium]
MTVSQSDKGESADIRVDSDRVTALLARLVRAKSENPPGGEAPAAAIVEAECRDLSLDVEVVAPEPGRPSVIARWRGRPGPRLIYCSHIDVVPAGAPSLWDVDPYGAEIVDGRMHGRGSADAKGCVAAALEAVRALKESGFEPEGSLELMMVADEETMGFKGAGYLMDQGLLGSDMGIVGEPTSLRVVTAQRGANWARITTKGVAAHGSAPERGRSAIKHMAEIVLQLEETLPSDVHPILGGANINVGTIQGGEKVNIVPAICVIEVDRRSLPHETREDVLAQLNEAVARARRRFPDLEAEVDLMFSGDAFEVARDAVTVRTVSQAVHDVTGAPGRLIGFRGASDARFLAESGAETVLFGPGDIGLAHTARESIDLHELEHGAGIYALAFARLLGAAS